VTQLRAEILVAQRYRFLNRIGTDPFTETWKAFDTRVGRPVALQLLAEHARDNSGAQAGLRAIAGPRTPPTNQQDASGRRILEGGEDPVYGPFVVTELGSGESTRRLPTLDPAAVPTPPDGFHMSPKRGLLVVVAVVGGILVLLAVFAVAAYVLEQANKPSGVAVATPQQVAGAQAEAPATPRPAAPATLSATQAAGAPQPLPTSRPTSPPANQATAQPTPPASAQLTPAAAAQSRRPTSSPVDTIRQHYTFIDAKRYAEGYALMDAHLRSLNSSADYQSWFVDKISVKPISIDIASQTDTEAVVRAVVDTTDRVDGRSVTKQVSEEFMLRAEDGAWRIDQVSQL
jgi:predicted lipid-binding transport protein (Tim44 family)